MSGQHPPHRHADAAASRDPHDRHAHGAPGDMRAYGLSTVLNGVLVVAQLGAGFWLGSVALIADAAHNAADVLGLLAAWGAATLALRRPDARHTYGYARSTILAALLNAALILVACGALAWESLGRLFSAHPAPSGVAVMVVASIAFAVNVGSAALFYRGQHHDLNQRGAFLHLAGDAAVSLAVVVAGGLIWWTGLGWIDPAAGLLVSLVVAWTGVRLMRDALALSLDAVPRDLDLAQIRQCLLAIPGINGLHDLHVWALSTTVNALTAHLEHDGARDPDALLADVRAALAERFSLHHTTLQLEASDCAQRC